MPKILNTEDNVEISEKENELHDFGKWRDDTLSHANMLCQTLPPEFLFKNPAIHNQIKNMPKCLKHLTEKICKCDKDCTNHIMENFSPDPKCFLFDISDLENDDKYIDCRFLNKYIVDSKFVGQLTDYNYATVKHNIYNEVSKLCNSDKETFDLICSAYELRDYCRNNVNCYKFVLNKDKIDNCKNISFPDSLKDIENILFIPTDQVKNSRSVRSILYDESYDGVSNSLLYDTNEIEGIGSDSLMIGDEQNSLASCSSTITKSMIPILLLSFVGYFFFTDRQKDPVKKMFLLVLASAIFGLSGFIAINSEF